MKNVSFADVLNFLRVRNFVNSVCFGMGPQGVETLIQDLKRLSTGDMLSMIKMRSKISDESYKNAIELFLKSRNDLSEISLDEQKELVVALGFLQLQKLFSDVYYTNASGNDAVKNIFSALPVGDRRVYMTDGLFKYYNETKADIRVWEETPEIMEFLADEFVNSTCTYRDQIDKTLTEFIVDRYGLGIACKKVRPELGDFERLIYMLDYASVDGVMNFFRNNEKALPVETLQNKLFYLNRQTLTLVIKAVGCASPDIERNLLFNGTLPEESVSIKLCFPQNFSALMENFGAEKVAKLFPDAFRKKYTSLWKWVMTDRTPEKIEKGACSEFEWDYVLADDKLCGQYIAAGGKLSEGDIATLLYFGKDNLIKQYRG